MLHPIYPQLQRRLCCEDRASYCEYCIFPKESCYELLYKHPGFRQSVCVRVLFCSLCPAVQGHCRTSVGTSSLLFYWQSSHPRFCYIPATAVTVWSRYLLLSSSPFCSQCLRFYPVFVLFTSRRIIGRIQNYC